MDVFFTMAHRCGRRSLGNKAALALLALAAGYFSVWAPASAIPLFAQRYRLQCSACHSVLPELNQFGQSFRERGYRLAVEKHGTTGVAIRYQMEYEKDPIAGGRRFTPGGVLLSNADIGAISAFVHYNLGAGGGPGALYLGYLATYNAHTASLYRAGLFELPLAQSPGQRLDDLAGYGYYGTHVGLNDLPLASPRWGIEATRKIGELRAHVTVAFADYQGSAYGGKPVNTGEVSRQSSPELGLFVRTPLARGVDVGGEVLAGARAITPNNGATFRDTYRRYGLLVSSRPGRFELQAEQFWGSDSNADGLTSAVASSGGYARLKYYPNPHAYVGVRYDAAAAPYAVRDLVYYAALHVTPHARVLVQQVRNIGGSASFGAALTVGFPWPSNL